MNAVSVIVLWAAVSGVAALLAFVLAGIKNRDMSFWIAFSFLIPPAVLILLVLPKRRGTRPRQPTLDELDASET